MQEKGSLFRPEALERLSSPERLDQLLQVVGPKGWIVLFTLGSLTLMALGWSLFGRIPVTVTSPGVLVHPRKVVELQIPSSGRLQTLRVKAGDRVEKGEILGTIEQVDLREQLRQNQLRLAELLDQRTTLGDLQSQRLDLDRKAIQQQRESLRLRIRENQALLPMLEQRVAERKQLSDLNAISSDEVLAAEQAHRDAIARSSEFQAQLKELESRESALKQQAMESETSRDHQIQEIKRAIAMLELQLGKNGTLVSDHAGRILEVSTAVGQVVFPGQRLGALELPDQGSTLMVALYLPIKDGKKIQPGMRVQVTPDTVKRERFGGILGTVTSVSAFPVTQEAAARVIGQQDVVGTIFGEQPRIEVMAELQRDASTTSGYRWSSSHGPTLTLSPGTTATGRVTIEEQAPISLVFSILRATSGLY